MKKTTLAMSALALSLGLALSPLAMRGRDSFLGSDCAADAKPGPDARKSDAIGGEY